MKVEVDPKRELGNALLKAADKVDDLTIPLTLITQQWFKSNVAIFTLQGPGKYVDLTELYKKRKEKEVGFVYPILKLRGELSRSITDPTHPNAISAIINKKSLTLGTNVSTSKGAPYAAFLDKGTSKMRARPVVLFGNEQVAPSSLSGRIKIWEAMILDYVKQVSRAK